MTKIFRPHWSFRLVALLPLILAVKLLILLIEDETATGQFHSLGINFLLLPMMGLGVYFSLKQFTMSVQISSTTLTFESLFGAKSYGLKDIQGHAKYCGAFMVVDLNDAIIYSNYVSFRQESFSTWVLNHTQRVQRDPRELSLKHSPRDAMVFGVFQLVGVILAVLCMFAEAL